jgi:hypothetical protein
VTLSPAQTRVANILGPLDGAYLPGGCKSCNAYQAVQPLRAGVWRVAVYHDDDCPVLAAHEARIR